MSQKHNVLVVSYGAREAAMADALYRSDIGFRIFFADKQRNPFNKRIAETTGGEQYVIPNLKDVNGIYACASEIHQRYPLRFVLVGPEDPIVEGIANFIEEGLGVDVLAPWQKYAVEKNKRVQRELIRVAVNEANPISRAFNLGQANVPLAMEFMQEFDYRVAIKSARPATGKGVVVYGDHFSTPEEAEKLLRERLDKGEIIIEEKLDGEESSFMAFCDGNTLVPLRDTRDYKRRFDGDRGPNTGGMGSYMDTKNWLPFMTEQDYEAELKIVKRIFDNVKDSNGYKPQYLKGMPFYVAFMHTKDGPKILEINSRPGDPEIINILPAMETDFGEVCMRMVEGSLEGLGGIKMKPLASVVTYLVPPTYGESEWKGERKVNLIEIDNLVSKNSDYIRAYPGSMEISEDGKTSMLQSRAVAVLGLGKTIQDARHISLESADLIEGDLSMRGDIASRYHIQDSIEHMEKLRG